MILNAIAEMLERQSKDDFKGRHFEAWLMVQAIAWYLRYPLILKRCSVNVALRSITAPSIDEYWHTRR